MARLTTGDLDRMERDERWLGFGYIGERARARREGRDITAADTRAVECANEVGMDYDAFFEWANSKDGRWYADCMFGSDGQHAELYEPGHSPALRARYAR